MPPICKKIKDEKIRCTRVKKSRRLTAPAFKIFVLAIFLTALFHLANINKVKSQEPTVYFISLQTDLQSNWMNAVKLVNRLLHLNVSVYWLAEPLDISVGGSEYALASGDFIIPFYQGLPLDNILYSTVFPQYVKELSTEFNVSVLKIRGNVEVHAYPLKPARVAVFYGGGVTGGSLEHIYPLEEAGFSLGIIREANLRQGELPKYNVITFPGGGPYGNYLSEEDMESIRDFVRLGGGFLGTCGGMVLGIELGLLDAEAAMAGQYEAYANLRGPVLLNVTQPSSPVVFGCSTFFESTYFMGPFISRVGSDVETFCSYRSSTENLSLYFPEIMKAYNFTPQTEVINNFWGSPSIIAGKYGAGKVVLSTVHPEILPSSQRLFINSIFYLSSGEETLLKTSQHQYVMKTPKTDLYHESLGMLNNTLCHQVSGLLSTLNETSSNTRGVLTGLEETNYQIVGVTGEYLTLFLDDVNSRSSSLLVQLNELINFYEGLESFKALLNNGQPLHAISPLIRSQLLLSIESLQKRILNIYHSLLKLGDLIDIMDTAEEELLDEKLLLQQILTSNMSIEDRYLQIISLHASESLTLCNLKDNLDCHLLNWSFEIRSILIEAHFLNYAAEIY
jgi:glutamine amidotransferase-like uncharacterized protein